jgi:hypothetical protein
MNVTLGVRAGDALDMGSKNVFIGEEAGELADTSDNVYLGYQAGKNCTGSGNVFIGSQCMDAVTNVSNKLALGSQSGNIVLGDLSTNNLAIFPTSDFQDQDFLNAKSCMYLSESVQKPDQGFAIPSGQGGLLFVDGTALKYHDNQGLCTDLTAMNTEPKGIDRSIQFKEVDMDGNALFGAQEVMTFSDDILKITHKLLDPNGIPTGDDLEKGKIEMSLTKEASPAIRFRGHLETGLEKPTGITSASLEQLSLMNSSGVQIKMVRENLQLVCGDTPVLESEYGGANVKGVVFMKGTDVTPTEHLATMTNTVPGGMSYVYLDELRWLSNTYKREVVLSDPTPYLKKAHLRVSDGEGFSVLIKPRTGDLAYSMFMDVEICVFNSSDNTSSLVSQKYLVTMPGGGGQVLTDIGADLIKKVRTDADAPGEIRIFESERPQVGEKIEVQVVANPTTIDPAFRDGLKRNITMTFRFSQSGHEFGKYPDVILPTSATIVSTNYNYQLLETL